MTLKNVAVNIRTDFRSATEVKMSDASKVAVLWSKTKMILSVSRDSLTTLFHRRIASKDNSNKSTMPCVSDKVAFLTCQNLAMS